MRWRFMRRRAYRAGGLWMTSARDRLRCASMRLVATFIALITLSCSTAPPPPTAPFAVVLGIAQDGGYPQAGCNRPDCIAAWNDQRLRRRVASLGIVDPLSNQRWMIDATPDFPEQLRMLQGNPSSAPSGHLLPRGEGSDFLTGILLTH